MPNINFRVFDADKNGFITKDELLKIVNTLYHLIPKDERSSLTSVDKVVDELLSEIDIDDDGVITKNEFTEAVQRAEHLTTLVINKILIRFTCISCKVMQTSS